MGWIHPSFTVFAPLPTVVVNQPNPFVSAATGSFWNSPTPGKTAPSPPIASALPVLGAEAEGAGSLPKPAYLPPWDGGKPVGRFAFSPPMRAKKASFCSFRLDDGGSAPTPGEDVHIEDAFAAGMPAVRFGGLGTPANSLPSTLQAKRSFHSSPTSPEYRSSKLVWSHSLSPSDLRSSQNARHA